MLIFKLQMQSGNTLCDTYNSVVFSSYPQTSCTLVSSLYGRSTRLPEAFWLFPICTENYLFVWVPLAGTIFLWNCSFSSSAFPFLSFGNAFHYYLFTSGSSDYNMVKIMNSYLTVTCRNPYQTVLIMNVQ